MRENENFYNIDQLDGNTSIWEQSDSKTHQFEIEKMLEMDGLLYISNPRPKNAKGRTYGGAAIVVNTDNIFMWKTECICLEVVWR